MMYVKRASKFVCPDLLLQVLATGPLTVRVEQCQMLARAPAARIKSSSCCWTCQTTVTTASTTGPSQMQYLYDLSGSWHIPQMSELCVSAAAMPVGFASALLVIPLAVYLSMQQLLLAWG
jgi:hypothetical protein